MTDRSEFFLDSASAIAELELIEISHSDFSSTYRVVRNQVGGVTVDLGASHGGSQTFTHYPLRIQEIGQRGTLDHGIRVDLGDLGDLIPDEIDAVLAADGMGERPVVKFWTYRSDDLTAPLYGPLILEIPSLTTSREGSSFEARAPTVSKLGTGALYTTNRFPGLRGFL